MQTRTQSGLRLSVPRIRPLPRLPAIFRGLIPRRRKDVLLDYASNPHLARDIGLEPEAPPARRYYLTTPF
ncbi:MAG: hypothetical protein AAGB18_07650 [Pseudomonadota bacterium]